MKSLIHLFLSILLLGSCSVEKSEAIKHYNKSKQLYENDDILNASSEIEKAILLDSSNLDFQILKAKILTEADNYEQAIKILKRLLSRKYKLDTVNYNLGSCYFSYSIYFSMKQKSEDKINDLCRRAVNYYNSALNLNAQYFEAYEEKYKTLHNLGEYNEALLVLNTAIRLFPDEKTLICYRGVEKIYLGDLTGAMIDLNESIQNSSLGSSVLASAYRFRANLNLERGNSDQAISDLTNALNFNPQDELALYTRALCYKKMGLREKACEDYRKAADLGYVSIYEEIKDYCEK